MPDVESAGGYNIKGYAVIEDKQEVYFMLWKCGGEFVYLLLHLRITNSGALAFNERLLPLICFHVSVWTVIAI